jgi:hypothetical protein
MAVTAEINLEINGQSLTVDFPGNNLQVKAPVSFLNVVQRCRLRRLQGPYEY